VVGITNAFNLLDNMDGLSAGVAAIAAGSCFVIAVVNGQFLVGGLSAALAGCALGFLRHNFHPARIYMGDAGSLYLGFLLAYLALKLRFDSPEDVTFVVPILVLGVPILDTTLVTVSRLVNRRSPFQGGRDHLSHRLVRLGLPVRGAVGAIYVAAASSGVLALVVSRVDHTWAYVLTGLAGGIAAIAGVTLGRVSVYDEPPRPPSEARKGTGVRSRHAGERRAGRGAPAAGARRGK
jgi:UDP-GlcNAc:undecaprenyl-phosphate GlcNAc-1-phosphate transferase